MHRTPYYCCLLFLFLGLTQPTPLQAQVNLPPSITPNDWGVRLGVSCEIGTHRNRIGLLARWYWNWDNFQVNVHLGGFYQACALGNAASGWEGQMRVGAVGAFGGISDQYRTEFLSEVGQNIGRAISIGYSLNVYWDNIHTSQITGSIGGQGGNIGFVFENDFLAFQGQDRFRTGAIAFFFQRDDLRFELQHIAWTADPYGPGTSTDTEHPTYNGRRARHGYRRLGSQRYHQCSAGILAVRALHYTPWAQTVGGAIGIDAEQIRHTFQNQFIHNLILNPHIPMIDDQGQPYVFGEEQQVKPNRLYGELLWNPTGLY